MLLFTLGLRPTNELLYINQFWAILFGIIFFLYILFFMYCIFIVLFAETLRKVVIKNGYPSDNIKSQWTTKDYIQWLFFWIETETQKKS